MNYGLCKLIGISIIDMLTDTNHSSCYSIKGLRGDALTGGACVILSFSSMAGQKGFALCH